MSHYSIQRVQKVLEVASGKFVVSAHARVLSSEVGLITESVQTPPAHHPFREYRLRI